LPESIVSERRAYTLLEMVVVVMILGILAAVTVPKYFASHSRTNERILLISLAQVRDAIDRYAAEHDRRLPAATNAGAFRSELDPYLRDGFPAVTVGPTAADAAKAMDVKISDQDGEISGEHIPLKGWHYNRRTGQFIINYNQPTIVDPNVDYDEL
jgi:prepilin-type N-terminal cleavage/methylation domain-containing protein